MDSPRVVGDRYRILRLLGRGGMGEVWLAHDESLQREVAIKLMRDAFDERLVQRFLREARAAASLIHPGIVTIFDHGSDAGQLYIAMEFVDGEPLSETVQLRKPLTEGTKLRLMAELCAALAHAHSHNVIHRDIKPANLMLARDGRLRVLDFGLARQGPSEVTQGFLVGSLNYMSPEQFEVRPVDARSDIFAAGAVFYELLTYEQAFPGTSVEEIAARIRGGVVTPVEQLAPGISPDTAAIVRKALERDRDRRFADCAAMQRAIEAALLRLATAETWIQPPSDHGQRDRESIASESPSEATVPPTPVGWLARAQARLIDRRAWVDYALAAMMGVIPLFLAWWIGALGDTKLLPGTPLYEACSTTASTVIQGYGSRPNWWPYFVLMPVTLFLTRFTAWRFFPVESSLDTINRGLLLRIGERDRVAVARRFAQAALDPRNLVVVFLFAAIMSLADVIELAGIYARYSSGQPLACPRELDWSVQFLSGSPDTWQNAALTGFALFNQFIELSVGLMTFGLLLRHNLFYLRSIYQRHRAGRRPASQYVVLEFDDVERCFGLRVLHSTFNLQIVLLCAGGILIISSRAANVDPGGISQHYQRLLSLVFSMGTATQSGSLVPFRLADLFPDAGQMMLAAAWLVCFVIVALPCAVKFLPLLGRHVHIVGRREYLTEFIPPECTPPLDTPEQVDEIARKFARSSFWPAGDDRARTLYTIAFFVFFFVLVPLPGDRGFYLAAHVVALLAVSLICTRVTFWVFQKALTNIDESLAQTRVNGR